MVKRIIDQTTWRTRTAVKPGRKLRKGVRRGTICAEFTRSVRAEEDDVIKSVIDQVSDLVRAPAGRHISRKIREFILTCLLHPLRESLGVGSGWQDTYTRVGLVSRERSDARQ